jgi:hypothetical protein
MKTFNVYTSQVILGRTPLEEFIQMSHNLRMQYFQDAALEKNLVLPLHS